MREGPVVSNQYTLKSFYLFLDVVAVDCLVVGEGERKDVKLQGEGERHKGSER